MYVKTIIQDVTDFNRSPSTLYPYIDGSGEELFNSLVKQQLELHPNAEVHFSSAVAGRGTYLYALIIDRSK